MSHCDFSPQARIDLVEIHDFVAKDKIHAAARLVERLERTCELLAAHAELGERRDDLAPFLRCFALGNYAVFYRRLGDGLEIVRVLSGARDLDALFGSEPCRLSPSQSRFPVFV
jgi:toxin ParE1/3/4